MVPSNTHLVSKEGKHAHGLHRLPDSVRLEAILPLPLVADVREACVTPIVLGHALPDI